MSFLSETAIDPVGLSAPLATARRGAVASFVGVVRDHQDGREVERLEYHAYPGMAEAECQSIVTEAQRRWPVSVALRHRIGNLAIGDVAIAVAVAGDHRRESFEACQWVVEQVKHRVPIWKKEFYRDGRIEWVDPTALATPLDPDPLGALGIG